MIYILILKMNFSYIFIVNWFAIRAFFSAIWIRALICYLTVVSKYKIKIRFQNNFFIVEIWLEIDINALYIMTLIILIHWDLIFWFIILQGNLTYDMIVVNYMGLLSYQHYCWVLIKYRKYVIKPFFYLYCHYFYKILNFN